MKKCWYSTDLWILVRLPTFPIRLSWAWAYFLHSPKSDRYAFKYNFLSGMHGALKAISSFNLIAPISLSICGEIKQSASNPSRKNMVQNVRLSTIWVKWKVLVILGMYVYAYAFFILEIRILAHLQTKCQEIFFCSNWNNKLKPVILGDLCFPN